MCQRERKRNSTKKREKGNPHYPRKIPEPELIQSKKKKRIKVTRGREPLRKGGRSSV